MNWSRLGTRTRTKRVRAPWIILGTGTAILGRTLLSPLLPTIRDSLWMSASVAGLSLTAFAFVTAVVHYPAGRLADGLSHQTVVLGGVSALISGTALLATSTTSVQFVIALLIYGLGMGLYMPGAIIHLSALFVDRRGKVLGLNSGAAQAGGICASLLSIAVLSRFEWQSAFLVPLGGFILLATLLHWSRRDGYTVETVPMAVRPTLASLLGSGGKRRAIVAAGALMIAMEGTITFLPTFLRASKDFPPSLANNALALYFLIGLIVNPIAGEVADRFEHRLTAAGALAVGTCGLGTLVVAELPALLYVGIVLVAIGIGGFWPPFNAHLMTVLSTNDRGSEYGAARTVWVAIGSAGPGLVGVVGDIAGYPLAFTALAGVVLCSLGALITPDVADLLA